MAQFNFIMSLNLTSASIQTYPVKLSTSPNPVVNAEKITPALITNSHLGLTSIDSLLTMIDDVNTQLKNQASQLTEIRTELNRIDAEINLHTVERLNLRRTARSKAIRKTKCRNTIFDTIMGSHKELSDGGLEVEVHLENKPKFSIKNSKYKKIIEKTKDSI